MERFFNIYAQIVIAMSYRLDSVIEMKFTCYLVAFFVTSVYK